MSSSKFYITTPIYYVNDKPHIGHAYTTILADVLARFHRQAGEAVYFLTGLDEHGQKVQQAAQKRGMTPLDHCNDLAPRFLQLWEKLGIQNDDFIRTTQERHIKIVQHVLQKVYASGDIYADEYEGWYSVAEERFITDTEKESGQFRDVTRLKEKNWFFKMSKYQDRLIKYIQDHPDFIQPEHRKNEILGFLRQPLEDLCISRPKARMSWGIEIPFDREYVTYVWFDALINYISAIGYVSDETKFNTWWPANVHLIGKDILTTHSVYWSTMLFALDLPLPKTIFAHGWWLTGDTKMSKSLGNVVNPLDVVEQYGVDAVRYFLMKEMMLGQDANFTLDLFIKRYNSDLANDFGNLLNRVSGLLGKYFEGRIPSEGQATAKELDIREKVLRVSRSIPGLIDAFKVNEAMEETIHLIRSMNKYLESEAPWTVAKTDLNRAGTILYTAAEVLRISSLLLSPVMPSKTKTVQDILGTSERETGTWGVLKAGTKLQAHEALFPRIEIEKK